MTQLPGFHPPVWRNKKDKKCVDYVFFQTKNRMAKPLFHSKAEKLIANGQTGTNTDRKKDRPNHKVACWVVLSRLIIKEKNIQSILKWKTDRYDWRTRGKDIQTEDLEMQTDRRAKNQKGGHTDSQSWNADRQTRLKTTGRAKQIDDIEMHTNRRD